MNIIMSSNTYISDYSNLFDFNCNDIVLDAAPGGGKSYFMKYLKTITSGIIYIIAPEISIVEDFYESYDFFDAVIAGKKKKQKNKNPKLFAVNYDQFFKIKLNDNDIIVIDEVHSVIEEHCYRDIMSRILDFIKKDKHKKIYMSGTISPFVSWLNNNDIDYAEYKFIKPLNEQSKIVIKYCKHQSKIFKKIKILMKYIIETKKDYGIHFFYNDKKKLEDLKVWLCEELDLLSNEVRIISADSKEKHFNRITPKIYLTTKSVERGVSSLNNITDYIGVIDNNHHIFNNIQAMNRERKIKVDNWLFVMLDNNALLFSNENELDIKQVSQFQIRDLLLSKIVSNIESEDINQQKADKINKQSINNVNDVNVWIYVYTYYYHLLPKYLKEGFEYNQIIPINANDFNKMLKNGFNNYYDILNDDDEDLVNKQRDSYLPFFEEHIEPKLELFNDLLNIKTDNFLDVNNYIRQKQDYIEELMNWDNKTITKTKKLLLYYYILNYYKKYNSTKKSKNTLKSLLKVDLKTIDFFSTFDIDFNKSYNSMNDVVSDVRTKIRKFSSFNTNLSNELNDLDIKTMIKVKYNIKRITYRDGNETKKQYKVK